MLALEIGDIDFTIAPRQAIHVLLQRAVRFDQSFEGLRRATQELLPRDPQIAAYHQQQRQAIYHQVLAAARKVEAQGLTWPGIDIEATCWFITALLPMFLQVPPETKVVYERWQHALADLIYHALFRMAEPG